MNQIPEIFPEDYYYGLDYKLWISSIALGFYIAIIFYIRIKKLETPISKAISLGIGNFILFYSIMRIFYLMGVRTGGDNYDFFTSLGYSSALAGLTGFTYSIEKYLVKKTKFLMTMISFIALVISFLCITQFIDRDTAVDIVGFFGLIIASIIFILVLYYIKITTGELRIRAIIMLLGILFIYSSDALDSQMSYTLFPNLNSAIPPILFMIGIGFVLYYLIRERRK